MYEMLSLWIENISNFMYSYLLIIMLLAVGLYFTIRTKFVQFCFLGESVRLVTEKKKDGNAVSAFEALMVSTASRVGTGNIVGVANAIAIGGYGAVFWMWVIAIIGGASAFVESTLAQIFKKRDKDGGYYGGPAYYIEAAMGGKRIVKVTGVMVPVMGVSYILIAFTFMILNIHLLPDVLKNIFVSAFDFKAILGGFAGSALMQGIKRGLYSNEAGVGSASNAAAVAEVSHPVKQGLVQMLSVFIDTILVCTATAMMCLISGIIPFEELTGAPFVQTALASKLGNFGFYFITLALLLFAFTTLIGNLFYCDGCINYILNCKADKKIMAVFRVFACGLIFVGAMMDFSMVWNLADVLMGIMAIINLPVIVVLGRIAMRALKNYQEQRKAGKDPVFRADSIGLQGKTDCWN